MTILQSNVRERKNLTTQPFSDEGVNKANAGLSREAYEERVIRLTAGSRDVESGYLSDERWDEEPSSVVVVPQADEQTNDFAADGELTDGYRGFSAQGDDDPFADAIADRIAAGNLSDILDRIKPGWSVKRLNRHVNNFLTMLALDPTLSEVEFSEYVGRLVKKLSGNGYTPSTPAVYRKTLRRIFKSMSLERRARRQAKAAAATNGEVPARWVAVGPGVRGASKDPAEWGIYDRKESGDGGFLSNFTLMLDEDIAVLDDLEQQRVFQGRLAILGRTVPFRIDAEDFADNNKLKAAIFKAGGPEVQIYCRMDLLRSAISAISGGKNPIRRREITTSFGWHASNSNSAELGAATAYLVPGGRITAKGFEPVDEASGLRVDLSEEEQARYLGLQPFNGDELLKVKRHLIDDLLPLHDRAITYSLLGASAAAVLQPFAPGVGRFAVWLVGLTGAGKSFLAKLAMNFFGNYPVSSGRFATWSSTANYVQQQGYFFKDALYLVDDYKPEVTQRYNIVRILQTYADGTARGRLKSDATANVTRPIRGLLLCTGEDVPEHSASAMARSVVIRVPQREKDLMRGNRCVTECGNYKGVMADFIRWLLANDRTKVFAERVTTLQTRFYSDVAGQQNDSRVTTNLALLGAAFEQMAEYLSDVWPEWSSEMQRFIEEDLLVIRGDMLGEVKQQQDSEVFLRTLGDLIRFNHVRITGLLSQRDADHKPVVGRVAVVRQRRLQVDQADQDQARLEICTSLAMMEVNKCLQQQGRSLLRCTESALLQQLREDGKLLDSDGKPLDAKAEATRRARLEGKQQVRVFAISTSELSAE